MKEIVFNGYDIEYYIKESTFGKKLLNEYNSVRLWVDGKECLEPNNFEIVFYNDEEQCDVNLKEMK